MFEVRTEIQIAASPSVVWNILIDFNHWQEWNPTVSQASGAATLGSKLHFTMQCEGPRNGAKYSPIVTKIEEAKSLHWHAKMLTDSLMGNDKVFELKEVSDGTLLIHKEIFSGLLTKLFWSKMSPGIPPMLELMNSALKKKSEQKS